MTSFTPQALRRWRENPTAFVEEVLVDPATDQPFILLPAEREFLQHCFKTGPNGRLLYPELLYSCPKKSGKTTFAAIIVITIITLYGGAYPEAVVAANDYEQSVGRVWTMVKRIVEHSPLLNADAKITQGRITVAGAVVLAIASDYAGAAGAEPCITVFDEPWAIFSERGQRLFDESIPPPTRKIACRLCVSYAGFSSESVVLEVLYRRGIEQPLIGKDLYAGDGMLMFWTHDVVAPWQDQQFLDDSRRQLRPNQYLRMIENRWVTSEQTFIDMAVWDRCTDSQLSSIVVNHALPVYIGIDASVSHDATALVAVTFDVDTQRVRLVNHRIFNPSPDRPLDFEEAIEGTIHDWNRRYFIQKVLFDPYQMMATSQRLQRAGLPIEAFPQTVPNITAASQNLFELIQGANLHCYVDPALRLAVSRAVAVESGRGWKISKERQSHRIDAVVALGMAAWAAIQAQTVSPELDYSVCNDETDLPNSEQIAEFQAARMLNYVYSFRPNFNRSMRS
jgi:phage terminase large subunit-like protein